jgi:SAM-dependent methyltransferase
MRRFLRKSAHAREPLPVAMIGLRMGERLLQIGLGDVPLMIALAAKPGISGRSALIVQTDPDLVRAASAAAEAGILLEGHVASDTFPFDDDSFDVAIVHAVGASLAECHRVLRSGGRAVALEPGTREGLAAWFRPSASAKTSAGPGLTVALQEAGFSAVRLLADREGIRFIEALKR